MLDRKHAFGKIEASGGKQVVFKLTNDVERKIADTLAAFATGENGLVSFAGAAEMKSVTIPKAAATR